MAKARSTSDYNHLSRTEEIGFSIHYALLLFQYRNSFLGRAYGVPLSLHESHILIECSGAKPVTAKDLIALNLGPQGLLSRRIQNLTEEGLLKSKQSNTDKRAFELSLTSKGKKLIQQLDQRSNKIKKGLYQGFKETTLKELGGLLGELCEAAKIPPGIQRKEGSLLRTELRRLARFMGVLLPNFMESGLSSTEWQILQAINYSPTPISAAEIVESFQIEQSTVSRILSRYLKAKYIREVKDPLDSRVKRLEIQKNGTDLLNQIDLNAARKISIPLSTLEEKKGERLNELLIQLSYGVTPEKLSPLKFSDKISDDEANTLRRKIVLNLLISPDTKIPAELLHPENLVITATKDQEIVGVLEIKPRGRRGEIINHFFLPSLYNNYLDNLIFTTGAIRYGAEKLKTKLFDSSTPLPLAFADLESLFGITVE